MAESIKIKLDGSRYELPTQKDITSAKQFILRRNEYARLLEGEIDDCLKDAAQAIIAICYKYDVDPNKFFISSEYNENMMDEIAVVMDELEADVLDRIYSHSTSVAKDKKRANALAAWIAILGRGNRNLQDTLDDYLYKTMKDWEAAIAALRYADVDMGTATTKIKTNLHSIYTMPEVVAAFKYAENFNATYIRSRGVTKGGVGLSNNGSTNVTNMGRITLQMAWMREQGIEFEENGAAGYYQLRGSSYPCSICDAEVGFHEGLEELYTKPYPHPHCCCYRVPIFPIEVKPKGNDGAKVDSSTTPDQNGNTASYSSRRKELKKLAAELKKEEFTNIGVDWIAEISGAGIKEWLNQPHKHFYEKNEALLELPSLYRNAEYLNRTKDPKIREGVVYSHIFRTSIAGEDSWLIVHEMAWGQYLIHSITDSNPLK